MSVYSGGRVDKISESAGRISFLKSSMLKSDSGPKISGKSLNSFKLKSEPGLQSLNFLIEFLTFLNFSRPLPFSSEFSKSKLLPKPRDRFPFCSLSY